MIFFKNLGTRLVLVLYAKYFYTLNIFIVIIIVIIIIVVMIIIRVIIIIIFSHLGSRNEFSAITLHKYSFHTNQRRS